MGEDGLALGFDPVYWSYDLNQGWQVRMQMITVSKVVIHHLVISYLSSC